MSRLKHMVLRTSVLSLLITVGIVLVLVFVGSSTAQALTITFTSLPSSGTLGDTYSFTIKVDIENTDLLPVEHVNLEIYNVAFPSTYEVSCTNLPIPSTPQSTAGTIYPDSGGGVVEVSAITGAGWGYASGTRTGYGYGYQQGWGYYSFGYGSGYGYGYDSYVGSTSITYNVVWTSPSTWPEGTYEIRVLVYGNGSGTAFTTPTPASFTLSEAGMMRPGAPITRPAEPGVTDVSDVVTGEGVFTQDVTAESEDGKVEVDIDEGTTGKTKEGEPISEISITEMADPPAPPADASIIGLTYDLEPDGATFDPPITLTFTYDPDAIPGDVNEEDLVIAMWDEDAGAWVELEDCVVDPVTHTITASVSHFTPFAVIGAPPVVEVVEIAELEESISELEAQVTSLQGDYDTAQSDSAAAQTRVASTQAAYNAATSDVAAAQTQVTSAQADYDTAKSDIAAAQAQIASLQSDLTEMQERLAEAETHIVELEAAPPNWGVIGGIIAGVVVIVGVLVYFLWWKRRVAVA